MHLKTMLNTLYSLNPHNGHVLLSSHYSEEIETSEKLYYVLSKLRGIISEALHNLTIPYLFRFISHNPSNFYSSVIINLLTIF